MMRPEEEYARRIADALFTDGMKRKATRLVMEFERGRVDNTGWCWEAVRDVVFRELTRPLNPK